LQINPDQDPPAMTNEIDPINFSIIKHLRDGRRSFRDIAKDLSVSENTIRSRVQKLTDAGVLKISGLVNPELIDGHRVVMVGVKLKSMNLVQKGEEFSKLRGVVSVSVVTGRFDLILVVMLKPGFDLLEFYTEEVSRLGDVQSVETFVVYKSYNLKVPYVLDEETPA
jgi:Lrp/AsnC family transcriptional regulator for asnA, asnC and gidA